MCHNAMTYSCVYIFKQSGDNPIIVYDHKFKIVNRNLHYNICEQKLTSTTNAEMARCLERANFFIHFFG